MITRNFHLREGADPGAPPPAPPREPPPPPRGPLARLIDALRRRLQRPQP